MSDDDHADDGDHEGRGTDGDGSTDAGPDVETDPFDDIDDIADGEPIDDPFTEMEVGDIDEDDVWAELADEGEDSGDDADSLDDGEGTLQGTVVGADDVATDADEAIVEKRSFCQRCEFFAEPPEVACTNEGTEIVELLDTERFRVRNCPVVAQRRGTAEEVLED
ncbi:hypothetical protein [Natronomonas amylolytica]|uniref:hypothetical protein n=1 Tax=Natronomonas amylolytica TaxID=3108498 RepID=UPI00300B3AF4